MWSYVCCTIVRLLFCCEGNCFLHNGFRPPTVSAFLKLAKTQTPNWQISAISTDLHRLSHATESSAETTCRCPVSKDENCCGHCVYWCSDLFNGSFNRLQPERIGQRLMFYRQQKNQTSLMGPQLQSEMRSRNGNLGSQKTRPCDFEWRNS